MSTLVFDIETVGESWSDFDEVTQKTLVRWVEKSSKEEDEKNTLLEAIKNQLGFSPLTGSIVSIALYDVERELGVVYYVGEGTEDDFSDELFTYKQRSEREILEDFWESALSYDTFVTFNGRQFDVPFILLRSVTKGIKPSVDFHKKRFITQQSLPYHVDLQYELTFSGYRNRRRHVHLFCRAFSI